MYLLPFLKKKDKKIRRGYLLKMNRLLVVKAERKEQQHVAAVICERPFLPSSPRQPAVQRRH